MTGPRRWTILQPAEPHERFALNSWDGLIGQPLQITSSGYTAEAVLVEAVVSDDGTSADLTFEAKDLPGGFLLDGTDL